MKAVELEAERLEQTILQNAPAHLVGGSGTADKGLESRRLTATANVKAYFDHIGGAVDEADESDVRLLVSASIDERADPPGP